MASANERFVLKHLSHRWLDTNVLRTWPGHSSDIRSAAAQLGLEVRRQGNLTLFFREETCIGTQHGMVTSLTASTAVRVAKDKSLTKMVLRRSNVHTPDGGSFPPSEFSCAAEVVQAGGGPWVVKPADARAGEGITTGVHTTTGLEEAWEKAGISLSRNTSPILLEKEVDGVDLRVFVVQGRAVGAAVRVPAFLVGDGKRTSSELLTLLNKSRRKNAYIGSKSVVVDAAVLARQEVRSVDDVLRADSVLFLNSTANIHKGGVSVDVTDLVSGEIMRLAEAACCAVPGLGVAGVDILVPDLGSTEGAKVIELNASANSAINQYPTFGEGRDVTAAIVRAMVDAHNDPARQEGEVAVSPR